MGENNILKAQKEIYKTLHLCNFCTRKLGISFIDELPKTFREKTKMYFSFTISITAVFCLVAAEITYVISLLVSTTSIAEFVTSLHIVGYGTMSILKFLTIWFKRFEFRQLVNELIEIWPVSSEDEEANVIKRESLSALKLGQFWYSFFNGLGVLLYNMTPLALHVYRSSQGIASDIGYVWHCIYPFDKTKPIYHELVYAFEVFSGTTSVWCMLSSDLLFTTMSSHITMLLRLLQVKIRRLATQTTNDTHENDFKDCYSELITVIKIHQRLINYTDNLENAFSLSNLINVLLSSVNICCVVFVIVLLEPWMAMSNKFFLGAALSQVGILCWYADDIYRASSGIADAVYNSGWYNTNIRCRNALLILMQRSQKPLYFTAYKFRAITMITYRSILTTAYSYFTLLYTAYKD